MKGPDRSTPIGLMIQVWRCGTKTSRTLMSWLPVPRIPIVCHVSMISAASGGKYTTIITGEPSGPVRGSPWSTTTVIPVRYWA